MPGVITASWQIEIARPVGEVFDYVADLSNEPEWNPGASNVVQQTPGGVGVGTVFEEDFKGGGHYITKVDIYEPPSRVGFDARNPRTDVLVRFDFSARGTNATLVGCIMQLTMKGVFRLIEPLAGPLIRREIQHSRGPGLKAALEN